MYFLDIPSRTLWPRPQLLGN